MRVCSVNPTQDSPAKVQPWGRVQIRSTSGFEDAQCAFGASATTSTKAFGDGITTMHIESSR